MQWLFLALAILTEVAATSALKAANGFTRLVPVLVVVVGYAASFYFMSLTLKAIPIGITYAIWSGVGIVLITLTGHYLYHDALDAGAVAGMALIGLGVVVINVFSKSLGG
jgi:small multidrug resistance pump